MAAKKAAIRTQLGPKIRTARTTRTTTTTITTSHTSTQPAASQNYFPLSNPCYKGVSEKDTPNFEQCVHVVRFFKGETKYGELVFYVGGTYD